MYGILLSQILLTTIFICFSIFSLPYKLFYVQNLWLSFVCLIVTLAIMYAFAYTDLGKQVPINYVLLLVFTLAEAYSISYVGIVFKPKIILLAALLTLFATLGLTVYAMYTQRDLTSCGSLLFMMGFMLMGVAVAQMFIRNSIFQIIASCFGVLFYGLYIIYDTQLMLGTKSYSLSIDDYIYAAMTLYTDIVGMFLELLNLLNALGGQGEGGGEGDE